MRLYSLNDAPPLAPGLTVRESRLWTLLGAVIIFGSTGALVWALLEGHLPPFFWFSAVFLVLFCSLMLRGLTTVFTLENWRLHIGETGITIKFRTPYNRHLPRGDRVIAVLPWQGIEAARLVTRRSIVHRDRREQIRTHTYIEFILRNDAPDLAAAIEAERTPPEPRGCISGGHFLHDVALMEDLRRLRIELKSPNSSTTPRPRKVLDAIERHVPIAEEAEENPLGR